MNRLSIPKAYKATGTLGAAVAMLATGQPALAQQQGPALQEITVTAQRRVSDLQSTPVAVTAIDSEKLESMFASDIGEVALVTPNFSAAKTTGFNAAGFAMRGASQTDILVYWEPPVGVVVDDFVVPHMQTQLLDAYDIESVEVMRGPQGTLFGKNTTAGVVNVKTKRPEMNEWGLDASVLMGKYGREEFRGTVNVPLVEDTLAFRLAAKSQESDGYYKNGKVSLNTAAGDFIGNGEDVGGDDSITGRAKLLWTPTENLSVLMQYEYLKDRGDSPPVVNETDPRSNQAFNFLGLSGITGGDPLKQAGITNRDFLADGTPTGLRFKDGHAIDVDGYYLNVDWTVGDYDINSTTGLRKQDSYLPSTYTGEVGNENTVVSLFDATRYDERETFQQEFRIASNYNGNFNFVAGLFYQEDETEFNVVQYLGVLELFGQSIPGILDDENPLIISNNQEMESTAIFFDGTYDFANDWTLSAGIRYTQEKKEFFSRPGLPIALYGEGPGSVPFNPNDTGAYPCDVNNPLDCQTDDETWREPTYRVLLSKQFNPDLYGYVSFAHGFKSGGYSDQAGSGLGVPLDRTRYDPEEADSWEVGLKWDFWDNRARINSALFYVDYTDMQRATIVTSPAGRQETVVFNAAEVNAYGLELEFSAALTDRLSLNANLGYLDTEYKNFELDLDLDPSTAPASLSGNDVTRAPEITAGLDLTYRQSVGDWGDIRAMAGVYYEDDSVYYYAIDPPSPGNPGGTPRSEFNTSIQSHTLVNVSATFTHASDKWYVSAFGKNVTDERYRNASQYVGGLWTFSTYAQPRVWGLELGIKL